jgi:hypothetical protein
MDGLARVAGVGYWTGKEFVWPADAVLDGKPHPLAGKSERFYLLPIIAQFYAEAEQILLVRRKDPVTAVLPAIERLENPKDGEGKPRAPTEGERTMAQFLRERAFLELNKDKALYGRVPEAEVRDWMLRTDEGETWLFWRALNEGAKEKGLRSVSEEEAKLILKINREQAVQNAMTAEYDRLRLKEELLGNSTGPSQNGEARAEETANPTNGKASPGDSSTGAAQTATAGSPAKSTG